MKNLANRSLRYFRRISCRGVKYLRLLISPERNAVPPRPVFIFGCHRSGTKMLLRTLDRSMETWVYPEHNRRAFDAEFRLRSLDGTEELVRRSPAPVVVFKPICESHQADRILDHFSEKLGSGRRPLALWVYRDYRDVTNSLVRKWGEHFQAVIGEILDGRRGEVGWRGERVDGVRLAEMARLSPEGGASVADSAALFWWLRNGFYFELDLDADPRVRPVNYDRLVQDAADYLKPVFHFLGLNFEHGFVDHIHADAVRKDPEPELSPRIREACEETWHRLHDAHEKVGP